MICPERVEILRALAGDLEPMDAQRRRWVLWHIKCCPSCNRTEREIRREQEEFVRKYPPGELVGKVLVEVERRYRRWKLIRVLVPAGSFLVLCIASVVALCHSRGEAVPGTQIKGDAHLGYYVQRGNDAVPGEEVLALGEGDRIQFVYSSGPNRFLFLVSLDAAGVVSNFNVDASATSMEIIPGNEQLVNGSIVLDDSPCPERVFGVFSEESLHWEDLRSVAEEVFAERIESGEGIIDLEKLPLPYSQTSLLFSKTASPPPGRCPGSVR